MSGVPRNGQPQQRDEAACIRDVGQLLHRDDGDVPGAEAQANNGVLFLDEVGDMPGEGQCLLLHALEARAVRPVGGRDEVPVDVQIICATNRDVPALVAAKNFREDVYHRIRGLTIRLTPLSGRPTDILPLLSYCIAHHERRVGRRTLGISPEALTSPPRCLRATRAHETSQGPPSDGQLPERLMAIPTLAGREAGRS